MAARTAARPLTVDHATGRQGKRRRKWLPSRLTLRIVLINLVPIAVLFVGVLYVNRFETSMVESELDALEWVASTLAEAAARTEPEDSSPEIVAAGLMQQLLAGTKNWHSGIGRNNSTRIRVYDRQARRIADSMQIVLDQGQVMSIPLPVPPPTLWHEQMFHLLAKKMLDAIMTTWRPLRSLTPRHPVERELKQAIAGNVVRSVQTSETGTILLSVAVPIRGYRQVSGVLHMSRSPSPVTDHIARIRNEMLVIFLVASAFTVALSIYLASTITRPIQRLGAISRQVRIGRIRQHAIPELSHRRDEIGELAEALSAMTDNLWDRMEESVNLANDLCHELKGPLAEIRLAANEALAHDDPERRIRKLRYLQDVVDRASHVMTEIRESARIDYEISRQSRVPVNMGVMVRTITDIYNETGKKGATTVTARVEDERVALVVDGSEDRLARVFENLIDNAVSFSPAGGKIVVSARAGTDGVVAMVDDDGRGIPENRLEAIFDRFYTDRRKDTETRIHSGLGLPICRQIVTSYEGRIHAENRRSASGEVCGARFVVWLPWSVQDENSPGSGTA